MHFFNFHPALYRLFYPLACLVVAVGLPLFGLVTVQAGPLPGAISTQAAFSTDPLNTPANGAALTDPRPLFDWDDADGAVISYTLLLTGSGAFGTAAITTTESIYTPTQTLPNGVYTWTVQAHNNAEVSGYVAPYSFTLDAAWLVYLPLVLKPEPSECPTASTATFNLIPLDGGPVRDHPDYLHADLNLQYRGYVATAKTRDLVDLPGSTDPDAPQLAGLFNPNTYPGIASVYQVNSWNWSCGAHGCPGPPETSFEVTLIGLPTTQGQPISIPERNANIYSGEYKALVLYADEKQITLKYTRRDSVANGYSTNLENVCVDPNLIALYRAQVDADGYHNTNYLPALRNNETFGTALAGEMRVTIRDGSGSFLDPRSRKDWWRGY
ncbi:MAG: hypothetical protein AB1801_09495 [Chloroflexota bacterium]